MGFYRFSSPGNSCCPNAWVNFRVYRASDLAEIDNGNVFGKNTQPDYSNPIGDGVSEVCQLGSSKVAMLGQRKNASALDWSIVGLDSSFDVDWTVSLATGRDVRNLTYVGGDVCVVREKSGSSQWEIARLDESDGSDVWTYENTGVNSTSSPNGLWYDATNSLVLVAHTGYTRSSDSLQVNVTALDVADGSEAWQIRLGSLGGIPSVPIVFDRVAFDGTDVWSLGTGGGIGPVERWPITYPATDGDTHTSATAVSAAWNVDYSCAEATDRTTLVSGPSVIYDDTPVRYVNTGGFGTDPPANLNVNQVYAIQGRSGATFLHDSPTVDVASDQASGLGGRVQQYHADADDLLIEGGRVFVQSQKLDDYAAGQLVRISSNNDAFDLAQWWPGETAGSLQTLRAALSGSVWACTQRPDPEQVDFLNASLVSSSQKTYQGYNAEGVPLCVAAVGGNFIVGGETTRRKLNIADA